MFRKAHEENLKQAELDKKKAKKEAEAEKSKNTQLASKNVLILDLICFTALVNLMSSLYLCFFKSAHRTLNHQIQADKQNKR